jgi:hypothetical protein
LTRGGKSTIKNRTETADRTNVSSKIAADRQKA